MATLTFAPDSQTWLAAAGEASAVYIVAPKSALQDGTAYALLSNSSLPLAGAFADGAIAGALAASASGSINGSMTSSTVVGPGALKKLGFVALPDACSRYYSPTHSMAVTGGLNGIGAGEGSVAVLVVLADPEYALPAVRGVARACPRYSRKTGATSACEVVVGISTIVTPTNMLPAAASWPLAAEAVRNTARINDTPTADMNTAEGGETERNRRQRDRGTAGTASENPVEVLSRDVSSLGKETETPALPASERQRWEMSVLQIAESSHASHMRVYPHEYEVWLPALPRSPSTLRWRLTLGCTGTLGLACWTRSLRLEFITRCQRFCGRRRLVNNAQADDSKAVGSIRATNGM
eukprot:COSAG03_NODE_2166_length_3058_cov_2.085502_2_plen_353_part_00